MPMIKQLSSRLSIGTASIKQKIHTTSTSDELFDMVDTNGSGGISRQEVLSPPPLAGP